MHRTEHYRRRPITPDSHLSPTGAYPDRMRIGTHFGNSAWKTPRVSELQPEATPPFKIRRFGRFTLERGSPPVLPPRVMAILKQAGYGDSAN